MSKVTEVALMVGRYGALVGGEAPKAAEDNSGG